MTGLRGQRIWWHRGVSEDTNPLFGFFPQFRHILAPLAWLVCMEAKASVTWKPRDAQVQAVLWQPRHPWPASHGQRQSREQAWTGGHMSVSRLYCRTHESWHRLPGPCPATRGPDVLLAPVATWSLLSQCLLFWLHLASDKCLS